MDHLSFDAFTRSLGTYASRRGLARLLTGGSLAALLGSEFSAHNVDAKKKRHKKKKKHTETQTPQPQPVFNQFGCLDVGQPCLGDNSQCCSGICGGDPPQKGKPDTRTCAAHNTSNCTLLNKRCDSLDPAVAICNPLDQFATCVVTTGNAPFCGSLLGFSPAAHCQRCTRDIDCLALGFPLGSACVQLGGNFCNGCEATQNRACLPPAAPA